MCQTGEAFTNAVASVSASAKSTLHDQARDALCAPGQLTDVGRTSATRLGASLREVYTKHGLLSGGAEDLHHIRLRSTKMARTLETCHNVATGLFPSRAKDLEILVRRPLDEDLYANKYCKLVKEMVRHLPLARTTPRTDTVCRTCRREARQQSCSTRR